MGYIRNYLDNERLEKLPEKAKENLEKLDEVLERQTQKINKQKNFDELIKEQGPIIADLIDRVLRHFEDWSFSFKGSFATFKFVLNIGIEVYQIIDQMLEELIDEELSPAIIERIRYQFGIEMIYFIWMTVGPLDDHFNWIPFKKTVEKKIVVWLAGLALDAAKDLFDANSGTEIFSVKKKGTKPERAKIYIKALA